MTSSNRPAPIDPMPPETRGVLPWIGGGLSLLRDPTLFFERQIDRHGPTFVVEAFGYRLFCVFSPVGVRSLYSLPENQASKGLADLALLSHKVPGELWAGRRNFPHQLFGSQKTESYLGEVEEAVGLALDELGESGEFELFAFTRRLQHRVGLGSWAGIESASAAYLDRLVPLFDQLDASESFVRPMTGFRTALTRKRSERRAMAGIEAILGEILASRWRDGVRRDDFLDQIADSWSDAQREEQVRGVARDIMVIHMGSQSNLYAATAWTLIDLLARAPLLDQVLDGDDALLEQCANESTRMAQRSITLRRVLRPITLETEERTYELPSDVFLTTMLSVTNTTSAPGLDQFDPSRFEGRRMKSPPGLAARELVSTFGHGAHACPAQRFSISAIRIAARALLDRFELTPRYDDPQPLRRQIGGVARADRPCRIAYRSRNGAASRF